MSKKLLAILLSAVLLFTSIFTGTTVLAQTVTNLIDDGGGDDGGFEGVLLGALTTRIGDGADDASEKNVNYKWGYYNTWVVTPKIVEDATTAYEGTRYLQATAASGYMRPTGMLVPVDADTDYVFTFYAKSDITDKTIYAGVVTPAQTWPQTTIDQTAKCVISGSDWTRYTIEFNSGDYTQLGLVFGAYYETDNTTDSYYVDDVALYKKADLPTVTVSANGPGKVTSSHAYVVPGDKATLTATPNTDSKFLGWYANGTKISDDAVFTVSPTESTVYTAEFFGNLISDGGFDTATVGKLTNAYDPSGSNHLAIINNPGTWYNFSTWILPGAIAESEGNKYINCTPDNTSYFKYVGTAVNIEKNTDYVLMFNAKTNRTGVKGYVVSALKTSGQHSTIDTALANTAIDNGESWHTYSIAFSSGELTQVVLAFGLEVSNAAATDYYAIDDVKLYKKSGLAEVTVKADGAGNVSASADYVVPGDKVTLTATPENGAKFLGWYKGSELVSENATFTVTVNEAVEYTAKFLGSLLSDGSFENMTEGLLAAANPTTTQNTWGVYGTAYGWLRIATVVNNSAEAKDGNKYLKVAGSGSYMRYMGNSVAVSKNTDYVLTFWAKNDISYGSNVIARVVGDTTNWSTTAIQESAATTISTSSEWNSYTLEFNSGNYEQVSLVFGLNAETSNTTQSYSLDNISLYKKADLVSVTAKADGAGNVSASANYVVPGDSVTLTATPENGAKFLGWYKGSELVSESAIYTVTVNEAVEYTAKFFGSIIDGTFEAYAADTVINTLAFTNEGTWGVYGKSGWQTWMTPSKIVEAGGNKYLQSSKSGDYMNYTGIVVNNLTASTDYVVKFRAKNAISYTDIFAKVVGDSTNWGTTNAPSYTALTGAQVKIEKTDAWTNYAITFNTGDLTKVAVIFGAYTASASTDEAYCIDDVQLYKKSELAEVSVIADGAGDVTPKLDYVIPGDSVTLTATPENGAKFLGWYKGGVLVSENATFTVTVNEAVEYTAKFFGSIFADGSFESMTAGSLPKANPTAALNTWGVYASANTWLALGEIVDSSADAKDGSKYLKVTETASYRRPMGVKVEVTKNTDYVLSFWAKSNIEAYTVSARVVGDTTSYSRTPIATDATVAIGKTDAWKQYAIAFNSGNYGEVALVFGAHTDEQTVETTYCIDDIALYNAEYVYNVNADSETVGTIGVNGGTVNGGGVYLEGDEVTLTATAETKYGFEFDGWYNGDTKLSDKAEYKFTVSSEMDNTINLTAKFVRSGINMIVNGDFESENIEVSEIWQTISGRDYFEVVDDPQADGAQGKVLKANKETAYGIFLDNVTLKAGHTYILKCKYYVAEMATHGGASNYERLGFWKVGGPSNFVSSDASTLGSKYATLETGKESYADRWITASVTVSPTEDTTLSVAVGNCNYALCNVDWYIDDIELYDRNDVMGTAVNSGNGGNAAIRAAGYKDGNIGQNGLRIYNSIQKMAVDSVVEYGAIVVRQGYLKAGNNAGWSGTKLEGQTFAEPSIEMVGVGGIGHGVAYRKAETETATGSSEIAHTLWSQNNSAYLFTAYVTGIVPKYYDDEYLFRTYAIFADGTVAYGDTASASIFKVANAIDNANSPSDFDKAAFSTFVNNDEVACPLYQTWIDKSNGEYKVGKLYQASRTATVSVLNNSTPLLNNYHGVSGTVYMPYTYFEKDGKRLYTDQQAKIELDRLGNSGFKTVRTYYKHSLAWDAETNSYDFNKDEIQWFVKWAKELKDRGLEISLSAPMRDASFATGEADWENEADYILGHGDDKFDECTSLGVELTGLSEYNARITKAGARVAYWLTESLKYFKDQGLDNITYITYFTETDENTSTGEDFGDEYVTMVSLLNKALKNANMRDDYKIIGPNQADDMKAGIKYIPVKKVLEHIKSTGEQIVDVVSAHIYPQADTVSDETNSTAFIEDINTYAAKWKSILADYNYTGEFWLDEYNVGFSDVTDGETHDSAWAGTQFAATICRTVEYGVSNAFVWSFADQLWDDGQMYYVSGISRSITESSVPYKRFYAIQMIARAMSHTDSTVYTVNVGDAENKTYAMCVEFEDGNWALMVVNTGLDNLTINTNFGASIGKTMHRYLYTPDIKADSSAAQISADKTFENVTDTLTDTIPVGGVAIYTSVQY